MNDVFLQSLEMILEQFGYYIRLHEGAWTWQQEFKHGTLIVHGDTPYTREEAIEDALRDVLGLDNRIDEKRNLQ